METTLRRALIAWLAADPALAALNGVSEEAPPASSAPWLAIVASASADWSVKDRRGREVRIALELQTRDLPADEAAALAEAVERRVEALPRVQPGFACTGIHLLRARATAARGDRRAQLIEYRFRCLET